MARPVLDELGHSCLLEEESEASHVSLHLLLKLNTAELTDDMLQKWVVDIVPNGGIQIHEQPVHIHLFPDGRGVLPHHVRNIPLQFVRQCRDVLCDLFDVHFPLYEFFKDGSRQGTELLFK